MVKRLTDHVNLGWIRNDGAQADSTTWNLAAEYAHDAGVDLMGEVYRDDRRKPWYGTGVRWHATDRFSLNASYAKQTETPAVRVWTVGFKLGL